ncbi:MAG: hypothetical protein QXJ96_01960 [Candidatus Aenigmatarchaeota archaeon]|nr:hypothetical protein [Candidatus Aenigmarchaeota archaeon]
MEYEIISDKYNPFLKRRELKILVKHENAPTPLKGLLQKFFADIFNVEIKRVDICKIFSKKGIGNSEVIAKIWDEPKVENLWEKMKKTEGSENNNEKAESK